MLLKEAKLTLFSFYHKIVFKSSCLPKVNSRFVRKHHENTDSSLLVNFAIEIYYMGQVTVQNREKMVKKCAIKDASEKCPCEGTTKNFINFVQQSLTSRFGSF